MALALLASSAACAQTDPQPKELQTITVTTEQNGSAEDGYLSKKITGAGIWGERDLQDTPYSMTVMPQELIENANAKDMDQLFRMNPTAQESGRSSSDATDSSWAVIRGFRESNPVVNGMSYTSRVGGVPMMQDIERVEIINGATGFLYGGGRVGGAVNYVTKKPTLHKLRTLSVGSYGGSTYYGHLDLGGQIDQNNLVGYRLNVVHQDGETSRKEKKKVFGTTLVFDLKPSDNFYTDLRLSYKNTENPGSNIWWGGLGSKAGEPTDYSGRGLSRNRSFTPAWQRHLYKSKKIENSIRWNISDHFTLRTNLFFDKIDRTGGSSRFFYSDGIVYGRYWNGTDWNNGSWFEGPSRRANDKTGVSAYLDTQFNTASVQHTLTLGYANSKEKNKSVSGSSSFRIPADTTLDGFRNYPMPAGWGNNGTPVPTTKTKYQNVLIGDDIKFNEKWSALVGGNNSTIYGKDIAKNKVTYDKTAFTPTLSLIYKPVERLSTYVTYIESLQQGTTVADDKVYKNRGEILPPYISKQTEIGGKYQLNPSTLLSTALFRIEKANALDINDPNMPLDADGSRTRTRDGLQVNQGWELNVTGKLSDNLTLMAGGTLIDAKIKKNNSANLNGKKPTDVAARMAKAYAEYRIPGMQKLTVSGGVYYTGKKFDDSANTNIVPAYTLLDAGLRYAGKLGNYPATFNFTIQNITDKVYWSSSSVMGDPRTFAFTVRTSF